MNDRANADGLDDGIGLTREVLMALPALDRSDETVGAMIEGMLAAAELLREDDIGNPER